MFRNLRVATCGTSTERNTPSPLGALIACRYVTFRSDIAFTWPRAERQAPGVEIAQSCCEAALDPRRLAHSGQRAGVTTYRHTLVGLRQHLVQSPMRAPPHFTSRQKLRTGRTEPPLGGRQRHNKPLNLARMPYDKFFSMNETRQIESYAGKNQPE